MSPECAIVSDIHLGSEVCQAKLFVDFLENLRASKLILNGDVFDSIDMRRLKKTHWRVLSEIRSLSDHVEVIWLSGNHDGPAEEISKLMGVTVAREYLLHSGGRTFLVLHGDRFDKFLTERPVLTWIGDVIYSALQRLDPSHRIARYVKRNSKHFLHCSEVVKQKSLAYASEKGCDGAICGHTHHAEVQEGEHGVYGNSGCWTELPCTYLSVQAGCVSLHQWPTSVE